MRSRADAAAAYAEQGHDAVREAFELAWLERVVACLLDEAPGTEVLDLGCGDCAVSRLAPRGLARYVGVDLRAPDAAGNRVCHDLRDGLGPVGRRPFDLYLGTFGVVSHLSPGQLRRLLGELRAHARPGALVALEALGRHSLEWPHIWDTPPGHARTIRYRLAGDVPVHPWSPAELFALFAQAGIEPLGALDRTLQAGPKAGVYWPGIPSVRDALNALLAGATEADELAAPLPPLPAGGAATAHHALAARRRTLVNGGSVSASAIWELEPPTHGGLGHGLLVVGRVIA